MALPPKKDQAITLEAASQLTANFRRTSQPNPVIAAGFWKETVQKILDQTGCVALRIYYGQNPDGSPAPVLVGVNDKGDDLTAGILGDDNYPCPPFCGAPNPLNS